MPATTTKGYPYPLGTDRVADGDDAIHALADAADAKAGCHATGNVVVNTATASTVFPTVVTFPVGRFPVGATPTVTGIVGSGVLGNLLNYALGCTSNNNASATINVGRGTGGGASVGIAWAATWAP